MNRKLEILQELISIGVIVSEPILVGTEYIYNIDVNHCSNIKLMGQLMSELVELEKLDKTVVLNNPN